MNCRALVIDIQGFYLSAEERELLRNPLIVGVILFARNYQSIQQLHNLITELRAVRNPPLLIAVDHEGGRVQRFTAPFSLLPALGKIGQVYARDLRLAHLLAYQAGWLGASELLTMKIDLNFAPVVDLNLKQSRIIGDRAFHSDPQIVSELAAHYIDGMRDAGMEAVVKHFPGHGSVVEDSHHELPWDTRSLTELDEQDILPFKNLCKAGIKGIMTGHLIFPQVDQKIVTYSKYWLTEQLINSFGFQGLIFSDDLSMKGAELRQQDQWQADSYPDRARAAWDAGCNLLLVCNNRFAVHEILASGIHEEPDPEIWGQLRARHSQLSLDELKNTLIWQEAKLNLQSLFQHSRS